MRKVRSVKRFATGVLIVTTAAALALLATALAGAAPPPGKATITVEKQLIPDGYQPPLGGFDFTGAIVADLLDGESESVDVDPGTYTVTENLDGRPFWDVISIECSDDDSSGDIPTRTATYEVEAGEEVTCVFTNQKRGLIIVKKETNPAGLEGSFDFDASYDADGFTLADGETDVSPVLEPGSYSVEENTPEGWELESATCDNGDDPESITLPLDTTVTCTFVNRPVTGRLTPGVATDVHDSSHAVVLSAPVGTTVHDLARVTGSGPTPTGTVSFRVFMGNTTCAGEGEAAGVVTLDGSGVAHPSESRVVPAGGLSFRASYSGDASYTPANGPCETLSATPVRTGVGSIDVQKSANPTTLQEPGGSVTYSVRITNTSAVRVSIGNVVDDRFGDLDDSGGSGCFDVPINLAPGAFSSCQFTRQITGSGGTTHTNVVTATGSDEFGNPVSDSDDARVVITERLIDLTIVKDATSPTPLDGTVNYSLTVANKGPDTATNVQLADPAPAGISYVTASPSQGTCNVTSSLVTCSLGTLAAGQTATIAITARATAVGSHTNTATVTGSGGREANPADNVDSAVTVVPAPLRPPTVKPTQPKPEICLTLTVSSKMITADGKPDRVTAKVTAGSKRMKGTKVRVRGAGVSKTARTNGKGVAVLVVNPGRPGIITVTVVESNQRVCGAKRVGVVGVFLPPLTG